MREGLGLSIALGFLTLWPGTLASVSARNASIDDWLYSVEG